MAFLPEEVLRTRAVPPQISPQQLDDDDKPTNPEAFIWEEEEEKVDEMIRPVPRIGGVPPQILTSQPQLDEQDHNNKATDPQALPWEQEEEDDDDDDDDVMIDGVPLMVGIRGVPPQDEQCDNNKATDLEVLNREQEEFDDNKADGSGALPPWELHRIDDPGALPPWELHRIDDPEALPKEEEEEEEIDVESHPPSRGAHKPSGRYFDGRRIYRVPTQLTRMNKDSYAPKMVSLGPYNHAGSPELVVAEKFKLKVVDMFASQTQKSREDLLHSVLQVTDQIRKCYDGITKDVCKDEKLAEIMLRDTIFLIYLMQKPMSEKKLTDTFLIENNLGSAVIPFLYTDMLLLDNQIPLSVINLILSLMRNKQEEKEVDASSFVLSYVRLLMDDNKIESFPAKDGKQPLHLLDACWRLITNEEYSGGKQVQEQVDQSAKDGKLPLHLLDACCRPKPDGVYRHISRPFRSVSDLKAKGIYFKPLDSQCVRHIKFDSWIFFGKLKLPILLVDASAKVVYSNLIAYEMSPGSTSQHVITSYINFMKSLIVTPEDVSELREKGILPSTHDSNEHVIKQFKEIDTYGYDNPDIFGAVKNKIDEHCKRKWGTWIAELIDTYLRSPWKFIGVLAAIVILGLTATQTYYAVNPAS